MLSEGTIIAKATASGVSAISVIRLSGVDSIKMVSSCFKTKSGKLLANQKSHTIQLQKTHLFVVWVKTMFGI